MGHLAVEPHPGRFLIQTKKNAAVRWPAHYLSTVGRHLVTWLWGIVHCSSGPRYKLLANRCCVFQCFEFNRTHIVRFNSYKPIVFANHRESSVFVVGLQGPLHAHILLSIHPEQEATPRKCYCLRQGISKRNSYELCSVQPPVGSLCYCTCAQEGINTKRRKKLGCSLA